MSVLRFGLLLMFSVAVATSGLAETSQARLPDWQVRDGNNVDRSLHEALPSDGQLLGVVISETAENGEMQLAALLRTQAELTAAGVEGIKHLHVIAGAPRLVQGFIRRGIRNAYADDFDEADILMVFPSDNEQWLADTDLAVTEQALWLWVEADAAIRWAERDAGEGTATRLLSRLSF